MVLRATFCSFLIQHKCRISVRVKFHTAAELLVEIRIIRITLKWFWEISFEMLDLILILFFSLCKSCGYIYIILLLYEFCIRQNIKHMNYCFHNTWIIIFMNQQENASTQLFIPLFFFIISFLLLLIFLITCF